MVDWGLGQHGVVLQLRLAQRRGVAGDEDQLGLAGAESCLFDVLSVTANDFECAEGGAPCLGEEELTLERGLVTQNNLTRLHHKCETGVEGITGLGLLLGGGHLD